jgi:prepilin-type processing-associated H-X9-DG protein
MNCSNNLKGLGLALQTYHDVYGHLPEATVPFRDLAPDQRLSWLFDIDPFVHSRMDPTWNQHQHEAWDSDGNLQLKRGRMPWYECPGGSQHPIPHELGRSNYIGVAGLGMDAPLLSKSDSRAGLFGYDRRTYWANIKDGPSQTVAVVESDEEIGPWVAGGPPTCRGLNPDRQPYLGRGRPFGGLHRRGMNALFADGSVRFILESINPDVLEAMATMAGGDRYDFPAQN